MTIGKVSREQVIQACLDLFEEPHYLEVGVCRGNTFLPLRAARKVAVDPRFLGDAKENMAAQPNAEFHEVTSDAYFGSIADGRKFDVIYLDGLHIFEQTLRDLLNAVHFLSEKGIIVIDDVYPNTYYASLASFKDARQVREATGAQSKAWMGDVYKLTYFIDSFLQQFRHAMVSNNHGQLVVWKKPRPQVTERTVEAVARTPYEGIFLDAGALRRKPLDEIVAEVSADLGLQSRAPLVETALAS